MQLKYNQLLEVCESVFESLVVTDDMAALVELETIVGLSLNLRYGLSTRQVGLLQHV